MNELINFFSSKKVRQEFGITETKLNELGSPVHVKCKASLNEYKIEISLRITSDFPSTSPLWKVTINRKSNIYNSSNNGALRTIEFTVSSLKKSIIKCK